MSSTMEIHAMPYTLLCNYKVYGINAPNSLLRFSHCIHEEYYNFQRFCSALGEELSAKFAQTIAFHDRSLLREK